MAMNTRIIKLERRVTQLETHVARYEHALAQFWQGIPIEQRMGIIKGIEDSEDEEE